MHPRPAFYFSVPTCNPLTGKRLHDMMTITNVPWQSAATIQILGIAPNGDAIVAGAGNLEIARTDDGAFCLGTRPNEGFGNSAMGLGFKIDRDSMIAMIELFMRQIEGDATQALANGAAIGEGIAPPLPAALCATCDQVHVPGNGSPLLGC